MANESESVVDAGSGDESSAVSDIAAEVLAETNTKETDEGQDVAKNSKNSPKSEKNTKSYKLKVNGKDYDVDSEDKLIAQAQRGLAIQQQWQQARSEIENLKSHFQSKLKEMEDRDAEIERDPAGYIKKRHKNAEDIMEQILVERAREAMEMEKMTPRERELYIKNKQYQEQLKLKEESEKEHLQKQENVLVEQQKKQIGDLFARALTESKIPANQTTVRVMAAVYRAALNKGVELTAEQAAELTKRQLAEISASYTGNIDDMNAADFVGKYPKLTEAIRKHLIEKSKSRPSDVSDVTRKSKQTQKEQDFDADDASDRSWDKYINRLKKEGNALNVKARW